MNRWIVALGAVVVAGTALAQGPGGGKGWSFNAGNTPGWALMSAEERVEHRNKMMSFQTLDECRIYVEGHHKAMAARAKDKGQALPAAPRSTVCDNMKQAGRLR